MFRANFPKCSQNQNTEAVTFFCKLGSDIVKIVHVVLSSAYQNYGQQQLPRYVRMSKMIFILHSKAVPIFIVLPKAVL